MDWTRRDKKTRKVPACDEIIDQRGRRNDRMTSENEETKMTKMMSTVYVVNCAKLFNGGVQVRGTVECSSAVEMNE